MNRNATMSGRVRAPRAAVGRLLRHVRGGTIELTDPLGRSTFGAGTTDADGPTGPPLRVAVEVRDPRVYERIVRGGSVGLGEAYADGWWTTDDLAGLLRIAIRGLRPLHARRDRISRFTSRAVDPVARLRRADPQQDARDVRAHYDIGNEFFRRILDDTMAYSSAVFDPPELSLADASRAKFDRLARMLDLHPGDRLVEIGTGWAGFALHAAEHYGCSVTTTTTSAEQYDFACARVRAAGLADRITVLGVDFRDVEGQFDKAIAIEMIEAVDWREYDRFFGCIRRLLTDQGALAMQAIVAPDRSFDRLKRHTDFIKAAIFPGGCLPSVGALNVAASRSGGLAPLRADDIGLHYGETLRRWRAHLARVEPELPALGLDERFARLWSFYFAYCEAGFDERHISAVQLLYATPGFRPRRVSGPLANREPVAV